MLDIMIYKKNSWCHQCSGKLPKTLKDYIDLPNIVKKSGNYIGILEDGVYNINKIPSTVLSNLAWWECSICNNKWNARFSCVQNGSWCPSCKRKTEQILYDFLMNNFPQLTIIRQYNPEWARNIFTDRFLQFDFLIYYNGYNHKIIIEVDGEQHFKVTFFGDNKKKQRYDTFKMIKAYHNDYHMIRIRQEDIYYNIFDWETLLTYRINNILNGNSTLMPFILSNNSNIYNEHTKLFLDNLNNQDLDQLLSNFNNLSID